MGKVNINTLFADTGIGSGSDRLKIESDGTIHREGAATVWDDIQNSLIGKRLSSTVGKVDYNWDENTVTMQPGGSISTVNDLLIFNLQIPHAAVVDGDLHLHMHWEQPDSTEREITVKYRIQNNGDAKTTAWTTVAKALSAANNTFTYSSGTLNQITELQEIDLTGIGISAIVEFQMARTDSETGDIEVTFVDAHIEMDTDGSREEYVK